MQPLLKMLRAFAEVLFPIAVVAAIGFALRFAFPLDLRTLNRISIYGLSPCLMFVSLLRSEIALEVALRLGLHMVAVILVTSVCAYLFALTLRLTSHQRSGFMLATTFMNSGNYGLSASRFAFGEVGFQLALVGYLVQSIMSQTFAVYLATAVHGNRRAAFVQVLRMPIVYAALLAIVLRMVGIHLDETNGSLAFGLYRGIRLLADATLPLLLLILGMHLHQRQPVHSWRALGLVLGVRLVGSVGLAYGVGVMLGLDGLSLQVGVLQAAMPTAVNMTIVAQEFDAWPQFVSNAVVASTLGSLLSLTLLLVVLR